MLTEMSSWKQLELLKRADFNKKNSSRIYWASMPGISLDYNDQYIDDEILHALFSLADACHLEKKIHQLVSGYHVNTTEHRPALHTALRTSGEESLLVKGHDIIPDIMQARMQMYDIANQIREGMWHGFSGKAITDIVNLGIGGSFLGPKFCIRSLNDFTTDTLKFHFISGLDPHEFQRISKQLQPETTLFIVASKSFTTKETLSNLEKALAWVNQPQHINKHFIAVTAYRDKACEWGIQTVLPIWDWIGGRYSTCSAINLITCIAIGPEQFSEILEGARAMDLHFQNTPFSQNLPVLLALLGIWNINFLHIHNLLMLVYFYDLAHFVPYVQQLDMESNGKSLDIKANPVNYATGPIIWGGPAHHVQHSYFQLLCQGTHKVAADLISVDTLKNDMVNKICDAHQKVLSNGIGKSPANPFLSCKIPTNHIALSDWTPKILGALMALYEHKIFTQSVIWNINAFDQPGVELSKQIIG